jgi:hypothetical protein
MVGEFNARLADGAGAPATLDAVAFMRLAQQTLARLNGVELAGERVEAIKCYLTGERTLHGDYDIRRLTILDKHGLSRNVFNAKVNIYRRSADPILLGLEDRVIASSGLARHSTHLGSPVVPGREPAASGSLPALAITPDLQPG